MKLDQLKTQDGWTLQNDKWRKQRDSLEHFRKTVTKFLTESDRAVSEYVCRHMSKIILRLKYLFFLLVLDNKSFVSSFRSVTEIINTTKTFFDFYLHSKNEVRTGVCLSPHNHNLFQEMEKSEDQNQRCILKKSKQATKVMILFSKTTQQWQDQS